MNKYIAFRILEVGWKIIFNIAFVIVILATYMVNPRGWYEAEF